MTTSSFQLSAGVIGFGCLGAGLSCVAPQVFSAAAHRNPQRPAQAVARVASIGWLGFFAGPVLIGGAAEALSQPAAATGVLAIRAHSSGWACVAERVFTSECGSQWPRG